MSASWIYASGNTATLPKEKATIILPEGSYGWGHMGNTGNGVVFPFEYSSSRNNYRLPASHQLNLGFNFHKKTKHGERIWNVSIMNAYNSLNPNHVFIDYYTDEQSEGKKIPVIQKVTLLPFLPSFSYTYKIFKQIMKKKHFLLLFILFILLAACTNDIEILPNDESQKAHRQRSDKTQTKTNNAIFLALSGYHEPQVVKNGIIHLYINNVLSETISECTYRPNNDSPLDYQKLFFIR